MAPFTCLSLGLVPVSSGCTSVFPSLCEFSLPISKRGDSRECSNGVLWSSTEGGILGGNCIMDT